MTSRVMATGPLKKGGATIDRAISLRCGSGKCQWADRGSRYNSAIHGPPTVPPCGVNTPLVFKLCNKTCLLSRLHCQTLLSEWLTSSFAIAIFKHGDNMTIGWWSNYILGLVGQDYGRWLTFDYRLFVFILVCHEIYHPFPILNLVQRYKGDKVIFVLF